MGADETEKGGGTGSDESTIVAEPVQKGKRKGNTETSKKEPAQKRIVSEEKDFVDDKELMAALQYGVLKTADDVALQVGERNGMEMKFEEEVINRVSALVWDTITENWCEDLVSFSNHAGRNNINLEDISLVTRRNPELFKIACDIAKVKHGSDEVAERKNGTRGKKRKINAVKTEAPDVGAKNKTVERSVHISENSRSVSPLFETIVLAETKVNQVENEVVDNVPKPSFLATPHQKPMTSTPKVTPIGNATVSRGQLFSKEFTPIRPTTSNGKSMNLTKIQEEDEDSFDEIFGNCAPSTSTALRKTNFSSLIRMAEENPVSSEKSLQKRMEDARLEAMIPTEQEYDSFDDDIIIEEIKGPTASKSIVRSKSPDLFADSSSTLSAGKVEKSTTIKTNSKKTSIFSNKVSDFNFGSEDSFDGPIVPKKKIVVETLSDDSFDAPIPNETTPKKKLRTDFSELMPSKEEKNVSEVKKNPEVNFDENSFDKTIPEVKKSQSSTSSTSSSQKIPKWKLTNEKWTRHNSAANSPLVSTPKSSKKSEEAGGSSGKKKSKINMSGYDSFDEFDFGV